MAQPMRAASQNMDNKKLYFNEEADQSLMDGNTAEKVNEEKVREARMEKLALYALIRMYKGQLDEIDKAVKAGRNLEEMIQEVREKRSKFTRSVRDCLVTIKPETFRKLFEIKENRDNTLSELKKGGNGNG